MIIRFALLITILLVGTSAILYLITRDPRYPRFIRQVLRFMLYTLLVFGGLYLLERFGLVVWGVLV